MSIEKFDNGYWVDISGILGIHRQMLNSGNSVNDTYFKNLDAAVNNANNNILPTIEYQKEVLGIVNDEKDRLIKRKALIDNAYVGQRRMVELTDSVTAKNQAYNYMLFVVVVMILAYLGIKMIKIVEIVPLIVLEIANIVIISIGIIYCIYLYIDIKRRYNMDFNQVTLKDPPAKSQDQLNKDAEANLKNGDLLSISGSQGSCQPDHSYNDQYKICVPKYPPSHNINDDGITTPVKTAAPVVTSTDQQEKIKYFANEDGTFEWKDVTFASPADGKSHTSSTGCGGAANYDFASLGCKTNGFRNIHVEKTSADAQAYTKDEFIKYGKY